VTYVAASAGYAYNAALRSDGNVVAWGQNNHGQTNVVALPPALTYTAVAAGEAHTLALRSDGMVIAWGYNESDQTNVPTLPTGVTYTAVAAGTSHSLGLRSDGTVVAWGESTNGQLNVPPLPSGVTYTAVAAGGYHSVALRSDGTVAAWGNNLSGQINVPTLPPGVTYTAVAAGAFYTLALRSDGMVAAWGNNANAQINVPTLPAGVTYTAVAAGSGHSLALRSDGALIAWGWNQFGQTDVPALPAGVAYAAVAGGYGHTLALRGTRVTPSLGSSVGLSIGSTTPPPAAGGISVAGASSFAGRLSAQAFSGSGTELTNLNAAQLTGTIPSSALPDTVARKDLSNIFSASANTFAGNVGIGTNSPQDRLSIQGGALSFASPDNSQPYVGFDYDTGLDALRIRRNTNGQSLDTNALVVQRTTGRVGVGTDSPQAALDVVGGVNASGTVSAAGFVGSGAGLTNLPAENVTGTLPASRLASNVALLDRNQTFSGVLNFNNPANTYVGVYSGDGSGITSLQGSNIAAGTIGRSRVAPDIESVLSQWTPAPGLPSQATPSDSVVIGYSGYGQTNVPALPAGVSYVAISMSDFHCLGLRSNGTLIGWGRSADGETTPPTLPAGVTYTAAIARGFFSLALRSDGAIIGFGNNDQGQLNIPALPAGVRYTGVSAAGSPPGVPSWAIAVRSDGSIVVWGAPNASVQNIPALPSGVTYVAVSAGYQHALALRSDGTVVAWGRSNEGQLSVPALPAGLTYVSVSAGGLHSTALRSDGQAVAWGWDVYGQSTVPPLPAGITYTNVQTAAGCTVYLRSDGSALGTGENQWSQAAIPAAPAGKTYIGIGSGHYHTALLRGDVPPVLAATSGIAIGSTVKPPTGGLSVAGAATFGSGVSAATFAGSGSGLTGLNASNITTGTLGSSALSGTYSNTLNLSNAGNTIAGNGAGLTSLNASNITTGTLPEAQLPASVARTNTANAFGALANTFAGSVGIGTTSPSRVLDVVSYLSQGTAAAVDQQQTVSNGGFSLASDMWQSFTPAVTGQLTQVDLNGASGITGQSRAVTIRIYAGEGTGGALLATSTMTLLDVGAGAWSSSTIPGQTVVVSGQLYTIRVTGAGGNFPISGATGNLYTRGRNDADATKDYMFKTYVAAAASRTMFNVGLGGVGIGTNTPTSLLSVAGTADFAGAVSAASFAGSGAALTSLSASNVSAGTLADARLSSNVPLKNAGSNAFTGSLTAASFGGSGSGLTGLNASNLSGGTVADSLLSGNIPRLNTNNVFQSTTQFVGRVGINTPAGGPELNVNGRMNVAQGVIQRGGVALTDVSDLGLYSQVSGSWIRFVTTGGAFLWFSDSGIGTNAVMDLGANGNLTIRGSLAKGGGSFKIDHPLDPENKYLYHSFVESPDMMNVYNGVVTLDELGQATVELPDYFEALNRDFRYQLTCIGGFAPVYISQKVHGNSFAIAGGSSGLEVSWQVTGIRHDAWAEKNRIPNAVDKVGGEKGKYLHPDAFGKPAAMGIPVPNQKPTSHE
jgi:alpha-tubulin suppressor-like RCC1 family protein